MKILNFKDSLAAAVLVLVVQRLVIVLSVEQITFINSINRSLGVDGILSAGL